MSFLKAGRCLSLVFDSRRRHPFGETIEVGSRAGRLLGASVAVESSARYGTALDSEIHQRPLALLDLLLFALLLPLLEQELFLGLLGRFVLAMLLTPVLDSIQTANYVARDGDQEGCDEHGQNAHPDGIQHMIC